MDSSGSRQILEPPAAAADAGDAAVRATAGVEVQGCEALSATTIHGLPSLVLGLPFLAAGALIVLAASDAIEQSDSEFPAGRGVAATAGALFGLAGVFLAVNGIRGVLRERRAAAGRVRFPDMPWRFDRAWRAEGEDAARWSRAGSMLLMTLAFAAFASIGLTLSWGVPNAPGLLKVIATGVSLITLVPLCAMLRRVAQALKYGRTYVRWGRFPAFTGERLTLRFGTSRETPRFTRLVFRLRCVAEHYAERGVDGARSAAVVCRALHQDAAVVTDAAAMPRPMFDATVHFDLPADLPGNDLLARPATFWEVEVTGEAPGLDYRQRFLVPVYARSRDDEARSPAPAAGRDANWSRPTA